jgi:hypothetical protein
MSSALPPASLLPVNSPVVEDHAIADMMEVFETEYMKLQQQKSSCVSTVDTGKCM